MSYVSLYSPDGRLQHTVFLAKETDTEYGAIDMLLYDWVKNIDATDFLADSRLTWLSKKYYILKPFEHSSHSYQFPWMLSFSLKSKDWRYLNSLSYFYKQFERLHEEKIPLCNRLEILIDRFRLSVPPELFSRFLSHILLHTKKDPDRIRILLSPVIQKHLEADSSLESYFFRF